MRKKTIYNSLLHYIFNVNHIFFYKLNNSFLLILKNIFWIKNYINLAPGTKILALSMSRLIYEASLFIDFKKVQKLCLIICFHNFKNCVPNSNGYRENVLISYDVVHNI